MTQSGVKNPDFEDLIKLPLKASGVHVVSPANYVDSHGWVDNAKHGWINANHWWINANHGWVDNCKTWRRRMAKRMAQIQHVYFAYNMCIVSFAYMHIYPLPLGFTSHGNNSRFPFSESCLRRRRIRMQTRLERQTSKNKCASETD